MNENKLSSRSFDEDFKKVDELLQEKKFRGAEQNLLDLRLTIPANDDIQIKISVKLWGMYILFGNLKAADYVIDETMKYFSDKKHPFVRIDERGIHVRCDFSCYTHNKRYLEQALERLEGNVFCHIKPFGFGSELYCYKSENFSDAKSIIIDNDAEGDEEAIGRSIAIELRRSYQKIEVHFDLE